MFRLEPKNERVFLKFINNNKKRYSFKITCRVFGEFSCLFHGNNFFCAFPQCACLALLARFALGLRSPEKREKRTPVMQGISMLALTVYVHSHGFEKFGVIKSIK